MALRRSHRRGRGRNAPPDADSRAHLHAGTTAEPEGSTAWAPFPAGKLRACLHAIRAPRSCHSYGPTRLHPIRPKTLDRNRLRAVLATPVRRLDFVAHNGESPPEATGGTAADDLVATPKRAGCGLLNAKKRGQWPGTGCADQPSTAQRASRSCASAPSTTTSTNSPGLSAAPSRMRTMPSISGASEVERATTPSAST